jgi:hypothetical protein
VALGPGNEEGRDVVRADVVEVAGDAERFGWLLSANLCRVQPPADEYKRNNAQGCQQDQQPTTLGEVMQHRLERFLLAGTTGACRCDAEGSLAGRRSVLISR